MKVTLKQFPRKGYRWHTGFSKLYFAQGPSYAVGIGDTAEQAKRDLHKAYRELKGKLR